MADRFGAIDYSRRLANRPAVNESIGQVAATSGRHCNARDFLQVRPWFWPNPNPNPSTSSN